MTDHTDSNNAPAAGSTPEIGSNLGSLGSGLTLDAPASDEAPSANAAPTVRTAQPADKHGWWWGLGRRKSSVARVRIRPASGDAKSGVRIQITRKQFKTVEDYFSHERDRTDAIAALKLTGTFDNLEVVARLNGGGTTGQAGALLLGISRALVNYDPKFDGPLREAGYLTRDDREVERKKYGQAGARRRFQFSKR